MAYTPANLHCMVPGIGASPAIYIYHSPDARATVEGSLFFTDGIAKGLRLGDIVIVVFLTGYLTTVHAVSAVSATAATINAAVLA